MHRRPFLQTLLALPSVAAMRGRKPRVKDADHLHDSLLTVDTHCDTPLRLVGGNFDMGLRHTTGQRGSGCVDLPRMKEGGLAASFFAVFVGQGPRTPEGNAAAKFRADRMLEALDAMFARYPELCAKATWAEDAALIHATGKRAIFLGMENGYPLGQDLSLVDAYHARGIRYITLAHTANNDLCSSSTESEDKVDHGLSTFGEAVVKRMNQLGMMVDVSHISDRSFFDVIGLSRAPILASHSCARSLCDHPRNLSDAQLDALKKNGGVIQLCILSDYLKARPANPERDQAYADLRQRVKALGGWEKASAGPEGKRLGEEWEALEAKFAKGGATIKEGVDHLDYLVKRIGIQHVGIGTDFDGGGGLSDCRDVTELRGFTRELLRRGYTEAQIRLIWGGNALRVMREVERRKGA